MMRHPVDDPLDKGTQRLRDALREFFEQMRFARAAELARSGRYLEAEGLLSPNGWESSDPKELDLLARISAQQGRYGRARRLWEAALQRCPGNADYQRAIERARNAERLQAIFQKGAMLALLGLATAALIIAVWTAFLRRSPPAQGGGRTQQNVHAKTTPLPFSSATLQSVPASQELASLAPQHAPTTPEPTPATPEPATLRSPSPPTAPQPTTPSVVPEN